MQSRRCAILGISLLVWGPLLADECVRWDFPQPRLVISSFGFLLDWIGGGEQACKVRLDRVKSVLSEEVENTKRRRREIDDRRSEANRSQVSAQHKARLEEEFRAASDAEGKTYAEWVRLRWESCACVQRSESPYDKWVREERERAEEVQRQLRTAEQLRDKQRETERLARQRQEEEDRRARDAERLASRREELENRRAREAERLASQREELENRRAREAERLASQREDAENLRSREEARQAEIQETALRERRLREDEARLQQQRNAEREKAAGRTKALEMNAAARRREEARAAEMELAQKAGAVSKSLQEKPVAKLVNPFGSSGPRFAAPDTPLEKPRLVNPVATKEPRVPTRKEFETQKTIVDQILKQSDRSIEERITAAKSRLAGRSLERFVTEAQSLQTATRGFGKYLTRIGYTMHAADAATEDTTQKKIEQAGELAYKVASDLAAQGVEKYAARVFGEKAAAFLLGPAAWAASVVSEVLTPERISRDPQEILRDRSGAVSLKDRQEALFRLWQQYDSFGDHWGAPQKQELLSFTDTVLQESQSGKGTKTP